MRTWPSGEVVNCNLASACLFAAMSAHRANQTAESRKLRAEANQLIATLPQEGRSIDWLHMQVVSRQAGQLFGKQDR